MTTTDTNSSLTLRVMDLLEKEGVQKASILALDIHDIVSSVHLPDGVTTLKELGVENSGDLSLIKLPDDTCIEIYLYNRALYFSHKDTPDDDSLDALCADLKEGSDEEKPSLSERITMLFEKFEVDDAQSLALKVTHVIDTYHKELQGEECVDIDLNHFDDQGVVVDSSSMSVKKASVSDIIDHAAQLVICSKDDPGSAEAVLQELESALKSAGVL